VIVWLFATIALGGVCETPTTTDDIVRHLLAAEDAYKALEVEAFTQSVDESRLVLGCLDSPISTDMAAWYHRPAHRARRELVS